MLLNYIRPKPLINSLRDSRVDYLLSTYASDVDTVAQVLGIDPSYLSVQVRILLPFYNSNQIHLASPSSEIYLIREILAKLRRSLESFEVKYLHHKLNNGIDNLPADLQVFDKVNTLIVKNNEASYGIRFGLVDESIGFDIQDSLHYIHKRRKDTKFHFGLFLEGYNYPICYCSISKCDRIYQATSLSKVISEDIPPDNIYVITRSFGFSPLPHNMMSKLFDNTVKYIRNYHGYHGIDSNYPKYLITALNPFLGFNGGIFLGSSFTPYATCPMEYRYNERGLYLNRRSEIGEIINQSYPTPPIVWLARPLTTDARKKFENIKHYYIIDKNEYEGG